ncbi:DUF2232 domain-containing protein [Leptolyngbya sp. GGD]|uniref:DUF2232 domain-containing protein n=1 Tax=Leptolyngbya sp. GGD TaxID=2997907 RepID=UPI00227AC712|nr:DUF2232 domain-containing protein [Leptolyngbya sp. GGD]MCY6491630.1 DUF2232 domain-containing protein [Leptolyngbya sp. GGD]
MTDLPNDRIDPTELDEEWIPDSDPTPHDIEDRRPVRRQVDPDSPIIMVETAFMASAASLVWLVNTYFPMGPILQIFFPIPIALIYLRWGSRAAWMGCAIAALLLSVLLAPVRSIQYVMPYGFLGVLLGALWYRRVTWYVSIPLGTLLGVLGSFFRIWLVSLLLGDDLWLYSTAQITNFLDWIFTLVGLMIQPSLVLVQAFVFVSILLVNTIYLSVVHLVAWLLLDRLDSPIPRPPNWVQVLFDND